MSFIEFGIQNSEIALALGTDTTNSAVTVQAVSTTGGFDFEIKGSSAPHLSSPFAEIAPRILGALDFKGSECSNIDWMEDL